MSNSKAKLKRKIDSFRLRMIYGSWYIYVYDSDGIELGREGPLSWNIATEQAANYRRDGLTDIDRV